MPKPISACLTLRRALMPAKASGRGWSRRKQGREGTRRNSSPSSKPRMAYRVKIMPRAERDLADIYGWIGAGSSDAARKWYLGLKAAIRSLRTIPRRHPVTLEDKSLRHLLYGRKPHV